MGFVSPPHDGYAFIAAHADALACSTFPMLAVNAPYSGS
jgi:hypothetical protein